MRKIIVCALAPFLNVAFAVENDTVTVHAKQPKFQIMFPANASTGYQWTLKKYDKTFLKEIKAEYIAPKTQLKGAGGIMVYDFALIKGKAYPKSTEILFKYARPWEPEKAIVKKIRVNFL